MKLLSWLRGKEQSSLNSSKGFEGDLCCLKAQVSSEVQDIRTDSFSFSFTRSSCNDPNPPRVEEEYGFDEDGFCGFLTIGTLGTEPETPKFAVSVIEENVTGDNKEMVKLITEKLDKFLEEDYTENTSSKLVDIRLNEEKDKETEGVCLPQGYYLFPSQVELTKRINGGVKMKKGLLTSLFKKRQTVGECSMENKLGRRYFIKSIFEKFHRSLTKTMFDDDPMPKKKELKKSVHSFRSKVHPVLSSPSRDNNKKDERRSCINHLRVPSLSEANGKSENWIKTDSEYHVLEL